VLRSKSMADTNGENVIGFIASTVEKLGDDVAMIREQMATKDDFARLDGRLDFADGRLDQIESHMATKEDLIRVDSRLDKIENRMATKEDLVRVDSRLDEIESHMATKEDLVRLDGRLEFSEGRLDQIESRMASKEDLARLDGRLSEHIRVTTTTIRGDIEQVQLRLDGIQHDISSRFGHVESELSRLRSAVYILGKDRPDVLRLLGQANT